MRPSFVTTLLLLCAAAACADGSPATPDQRPEPEPDTVAERSTAFVDVNVVPMDAERVVEGQTVVVHGDTIVAMGPAGSVQIPEEAQIVDGTGRWLMPGLTDMHTHLGVNWAEFTSQRPPDAALQEMAEGQMLLYLANGVTTIFDMGRFGAPILRWRSEVIEGRYPGPTIYAARWLRGPPGTPDGGPSYDAPTTAAAARQYVRETVDQGYHLLKLYNWPSREVVLAAMDEASALDLAIGGHFPQTLPTAEVLASGMDLVAHAEAYLWTYFDNAVHDERVPDAVDMTRNADAWVTTTLGVTKWEAAVWGGNQVGIAAFWALPEVRYMHFTEVGLHREGLEGTRWNPPGAQPGGYDARYQFVLRYTRALYDGGVRLLIGTDSPTVLGAAGFSLHRELATVQDELGLSTYEVLQLATRNPGDFVEEHVPGTSRFGRVEVGRRADLLLLEANPLESLENVKRRAAVMARGRLYMEDALQAGIEELAARYGGG